MAILAVFLIQDFLVSSLLIKYKNKHIGTKKNSIVKPWTTGDKLSRYIPTLLENTIATTTIQTNNNL